MALCIEQVDVDHMSRSLYVTCRTKYVQKYVQRERERARVHVDVDHMSRSLSRTCRETMCVCRETKYVCIWI